jgi:hypothetical protein
MSSNHEPVRLSPAELHRTNQVITLGTWTLITAVCTFSAITGARFIGAHSPWHWSGWILAGGIDASFVMALQVDATLARHSTTGGPWPTAFRWTTGTCSVFVNTGDAALQRDGVGFAIHLIAPTLLLVLGEAGPAWRLQLASLEGVPGSDPALDEPAHTSRRPGHENDHETAPPANADEARSRIILGRLNGLSQRETARVSHRSPSFVRKVWTSMDDAQQPGLPPPST